MPMYRRKTAQLRAVKLERDSWNEALKTKKEERTEDQNLLVKIEHQANKGFFIEGNSGPVLMGIGDYVAVRGTSEVQGIKKENFEELYEPCEEPQVKEEDEDSPAKETLKEKAARLLLEKTE